MFSERRAPVTTRCPARPKTPPDLPAFLPPLPPAGLPTDEECWLVSAGASAQSALSFSLSLSLSLAFSL
eukprot:COSAG01_NODE_8906_length_2620_cov_2.646965_1_plen_68_part_10